MVRFTPVLRVAALNLVGALVLGSAVAEGQCLDFLTSMKTYNCLGAPPPPEANSKSLESVVIDWHGKPFLFMSTGNELELYDITNPNAPSSLGKSNFSPGNLGDSDYDLMSFEVCDDCRFGIANYKMGIVVFDLGTNAARPTFGPKYVDVDLKSVLGGMAFTYNGRYYVLANELTSTCGDAALFEVTNPGQVTLQFLGCYTVPGALETRVLGGFKVGSSHLYISNQNATVQIARIVSSGAAISLQYVADAPFQARQQLGKGFDVDPVKELVVASGSDGQLEVYDFGGQIDPAATVTAPRRLTRIGPAALQLPNARNVAIQWPLVLGGYRGTSLAPEIYDLSGVTQNNPNGWVGPLDPDFWNAANSWNDWDCRKEYDAAFHPSGGALYMARYQVGQAIDTAECSGPSAPTAAVTVSPSSVFPGTDALITDASAGAVERRAIWVTNGSNPAAQAVSGSKTLVTATSTNRTWTFPIPAGLALEDDYYAHVAVDNQYSTCPGTLGDSCPAEQLDSERINLNRTPETTVSLSNPAPTTGAVVTLIPDAEGVPAPDTGQSSAYTWTVTYTPPGGGTPSDLGPFAPDAQGRIQLTLDPSGTYSYKVKVDYAHERSTGTDLDDDPNYEYETPEQSIQVSSVAANFTMSPTSPLHTQTITLTSTSNAASGAVLTYDWDVLTSDGSTIVNSLAGCTGTPCVIPGETLSPGTYDFRLTLTNTAATPNDVSSKVLENRAIADGSMQLSLSVNDSTPAIGQIVTFSVTGVDGSAIERATWNFGGTSCDPSSSPVTWTCTQTPYCGGAGYQYATAGTKNVSVTVVVAGQSFPVSTQVTVSSSGTCGGSTQCTYSLSPTSRSFTAAGGSGNFTVSTQAGCSWNATESESFITLVGSTGGSGSGTVNFAVLENTSSSSRTGRIYAGGQAFTVSQSGAEPCSYTINPTSATAEGGGGNGTILVTAGSSCQWSAVSHAGWLRVTAGASGTGNGSVTWAADPNPYQANRTGQIIIQDKTFTVTQYPVLPAEFTVSNLSPDKGEYVTFTVDSRLQVARWNFGDDGSTGGRNCLDEGPIFNCTGLPEASCESIRWNWPDRGPKYVTMTLTDGRSSTQRLSVQADGECPCVLEPPATSFQIDPNPVYAMEEVTFTDTTPGTPGGAAKIQATITYSPTSPEIGERVNFTLSGAGTIDRADWTFGANGCDGASSQQCLGNWCNLGTTFYYAQSGTFTVRVTTYLNGSVTGNGQTTLTVLPTGSCGGTSCSYTVSPTSSTTFPATGGNGSFAVSTNTSSCSWTAASNSTWIQVTGGGTGTGSGTVSYSVQANTGAARTGSISVQGKQHTVTQAAASGGCSYGVSPASSPTFSASGGNGSFNVTTSESSCAWTATSNHAWIRLTGATSGTGAGTVGYIVDPNTGAARTGSISVQGWQHVVNQAEAAEGGPPETWSWRVTLDGVEQVTSDQTSFAWTPRRAGTYQVSLTTSNCGGSTTLTRNLEVLPPLIPPIEEYVVPSAVHTRGENETLWKTDLRIFNPCEAEILVDMRYLQDATNNNGTFLRGVEFSLAPNGTRLYNDVVEAIPGLVGDDNKGSLRISFDAPESCLPMIMSRTYNDTPNGTFGQYVPAVPVLPAQGDRMYLTGLAHNLYFRTNLGFANFTDTDVTLQVQLLDERGDPIGDPVYPSVPAFSTRQVLRVAERANLFTDVNAFSARIDTGGAAVAGYASVVDNITGDPVYFSPTEGEDTMLWLPGVAHLTGLNDSRWRTDITFFNAFDVPDTSRLDYFPESTDNDHFFLEFLGIEPGESFFFVDILEFMLGDVESKGFFTLTSLDGNPVPRIAARTYNLDAAGGTFGQNLLAFGEDDLIVEGQVAFIPGVANSPRSDEGFRTNLGVINTDQDSWLSLRVTVYAEDGSVAGERESWNIEPGQSRQPNLFQLVGLAGVAMEGSLEVEVLSGGPAAIYVSEIDNRTQDPIFIPAIRDPAAEQ